MTPHRLRLLFAASLMLLTGVATATLKPAPSGAVIAPDLDAMLPDAFAGWRRIALSDAVLPAETELKEGEAVAYRAYRDELDRTVTLVVAYGPPLGDSVRLHRPEKCYVAQGFEILDQSRAALSAGARIVTIVNLDAQSPARREAVSYWLRDGDGFSGRAGENALRRLRAGLSRPLDGALVRVSTINAEAPQFDLNEAFLVDFANALRPDARALLLGGEEGA
ncbi:MAG TPA: EpsI family protein [Parvularculaceae bacterium]|nr:EpsI family protein [Parvularculaceae bacterium]